MFESVCDCCGKRKDLNVYILRIERISDPSIAIRYDMREAEVIPNDRREEQTIKYLLCSHCYNKTGLPLFAFGKKQIPNTSIISTHCHLFFMSNRNQILIEHDTKLIRE